MYQNERIYKKYLTFIFSILFVLLTIGKVHSSGSQLREAVSSIEGLSAIEVEQLSHLLEEKFLPLTKKGDLNTSVLDSIRNIISAGIFEQASFNTIADVAAKAYQSEINGAPSMYVEDLALIGFSNPLTQNQLEMAAKSIEKLINNGIEPLVIEELISYGIYNGWKGSTIYAVSDGILTGVSVGLEARKLALSFIISIDQERNKKDVNEIIGENIQFLKTVEKQPPQETNRRELAYQYLQNALTQNIPRQVGEEIYFTAIEEKWPTDAIKAVFNGLIKGHKMGLTTDKLAIAFIVRIAQGLGDVSPENMVEHEIEYIKQLEEKRLTLIKSDHKKHKRELKPINQYQHSYIQPKKAEEKKQKTAITYYPTTTRRTLNEGLMKQTIWEFLGPPTTPYRWGGSSRRGIDCSGFSQAIYRAQGIYLPRTSRQQVQVGILVRDQLMFGDLVFFSKYFNNYITHVGIYIGNSKFVHSSGTKGVTISSLNQKYYRARYRGAKRIIY